MPAFLFKRLTRDALNFQYEPFRHLAFEVIARCEARGAWYYAIRGFSTFAEQQALHQNYVNGRGGKAAPAGYSAHNYGLAFDFCRDSDLGAAGLQPDWTQPAYTILGEETQNAGLVWGKSFGDAPHIQWPGFVGAGQLEQLRSLWRQQPAQVADSMKLLAVRQYLDALRETDTWKRANPKLSHELERLGY
jgi:peptidoglycan L-alanyl-D-glutamate endopeptidase CwlK